MYLLYLHDIYKKVNMADCFKLKNPEEDLGYLIWRITKYWQRGKHRMLDEFGLTGSQTEFWELYIIYPSKKTK